MKAQRAWPSSPNISNAGKMPPISVLAVFKRPMHIGRGMTIDKGVQNEIAMSLRVSCCTFILAATPARIVLHSWQLAGLEVLNFSMRVTASPTKVVAFGSPGAGESVASGPTILGYVGYALSAELKV
jgi:hypothetical protein